MISSFARSCFSLPLLSILLAAQPQSEGDSLKIVTVEGEGGINNIRQRSAPVTTVRVEDSKQQPVSGAVVVFVLPVDGPSGVFQNGAKTLTVTTNEQGIASARGLKSNNVSGEMPIHVNASYQGRTGTATITQFNMAVPSAKAGSGKLLIILAVVGAAAAGGAYAGLHKSGSSSPAPAASVAAGPITITPGTGTVGPPQ